MGAERGPHELLGYLRVSRRLYVYPFLINKTVKSHEAPLFWMGSQLRWHEEGNSPLALGPFCYLYNPSDLP